MKKYTYRIGAQILATVLPLSAALAQGVLSQSGTAPAGNVLDGIFFFILDTINGLLVPLIFAVAFLSFVYGAYTFFIAGRGNEEKVQQGRNFMVSSLIGFFLMFSIWGIINVLINSVPFFSSNIRPCVPAFGTQSCY